MGHGNAVDAASAPFKRREWGMRQTALSAVFVLAAFLLSGCVRPTGDFDRAKPSVIHDDLMPAVPETKRHACAVILSPNSTTPMTKSCCASAAGR